MELVHHQSHLARQIHEPLEGLLIVCFLKQLDQLVLLVDLCFAEQATVFREGGEFGGGEVLVGEETSLKSVQQLLAALRGCRVLEVDLERAKSVLESGSGAFWAGEGGVSDQLPVVRRADTCGGGGLAWLEVHCWCGDGASHRVNGVGCLR